MDNKNISQILESSTASKVLRSDDIPAIDLYLDQILTLVADKTGKDSSSGGLTKTMINNYSKDGLLKPVKGKKYSKEHIVQMMIIFYLKGMLTIGDIKRLFDGVYSDESFNGDCLISSYDRFLDIKQDEQKLFSYILKHLTEKNGLNAENTDDFLILLMSVVSCCDNLKSFALAMLDEKYPPTEKPQKQEKEPKDKKAKKEKDTKKNTKEE